MSGQAFGFLCVLHSVFDILSHAAKIRAAQIAGTTPLVPITTGKRTHQVEATSSSVVDLKPENLPSRDVIYDPVTLVSSNNKSEGSNVLPPALQDVSVPTQHLQSSKVPSSRIGRLFHYGGRVTHCVVATLEATLTKLQAWQLH